MRHTLLVLLRRSDCAEKVSGTGTGTDTVYVSRTRVCLSVFLQSSHTLRPPSQWPKPLDTRQMNFRHQPHHPQVSKALPHLFFKRTGLFLSDLGTSKLSCLYSALLHFEISFFYLTEVDPEPEWEYKRLKAKVWDDADNIFKYLISWKPSIKCERGQYFGASETLLKKCWGRFLLFPLLRGKLQALRDQNKHKKAWCSIQFTALLISSQDDSWELPSAISEEDRREFNKTWEKNKGQPIDADEGNRCANCDSPLTSLDLKLKRGNDIFRDGKGCIECINHFIRTGTLRETLPTVPKPPARADSLASLDEDWLSKKHITAGISFKPRPPPKWSPSPMEVHEEPQSRSPVKKRRRKIAIVASDDDDEDDKDPVNPVSSSDSDLPLKRALKRHRNESEPDIKVAAQSPAKKPKRRDVEGPILPKQREEERKPGKAKKSTTKPQPEKTITDRKGPRKSPPVAASSSASHTNDWNGIFSETESDEPRPKAKKAHRDKDARSSSDLRAPQIASSSVKKNEPSSEPKDGRKVDRIVRRLSDRPPVSAPSAARASDEEAIRKPERKSSISRASDDEPARKAKTHAPSTLRASDDDEASKAKTKLRSVLRASDDEALPKAKAKLRASDDEVSRKPKSKPVANGTSKAPSSARAKQGSASSAGQNENGEQALAPGLPPPTSPRSKPEESAPLRIGNLRQSPAPQISPQALPRSPRRENVVEMDVSDSIENVGQHSNSIFAVGTQDECDAANYDWNVPWLDDLTASMQNMQAVIQAKRGQRAAAVCAAAAPPPPPPETGSGKRSRTGTPVSEVRFAQPFIFTPNGPCKCAESFHLP
ncbi:hypothetical protein BDZ88DRAFT_257092 [Geranomyces variabilis]|nr:hypothetical protein BDZ88DRAFT_257092 [Geranomyces variabilis]